jgi:hypothetical protein
MLALSSPKRDAQTQGSTPIPMLESSTWNIFKRSPPKEGLLLSQALPT